MNWLLNNAGTIICSLVVVLIAALAIRSVIKEKSSGKCSCGGNCSACGACGGTGSLMDEAKRDILRGRKEA